jgi:hypothetical protein
MRLLLGSLTVALTLVVGTAFASTVRIIKVGDFFFVKDTSGTPTVHVATGRTVEWKWVGQEPHNIKVISGPVKFSAHKRIRGTYTRKMTTPGTYLLECTIHRFKMRLVVGDTTTPPAPTPTPTPTPY